MRIIPSVQEVNQLFYFFLGNPCVFIAIKLSLCIYLYHNSKHKILISFYVNFEYSVLYSKNTPQNIFSVTPVFQNHWFARRLTGTIRTKFCSRNQYFIEQKRTKFLWVHEGQKLSYGTLLSCISIIKQSFKEG